MEWFLFGINIPMLYAITNHFDKQIMARFFKEGGPGALLIVSALFSVVVMALLWLGYDWVVIPVSNFWFELGYDLQTPAEPGWFDIGIFHMAILFLSGIFNVGIVWFYLLALRQDHAARVVVFYQLVPVIGLVLGFVFLHEVVSLQQLLAMMLIICGATILSFDMDANGSLRFKRKTVVYMLLACLSWALQAVLFKYAALEVNAWRGMFWQHMAMFLVGVAVFLFSSKYRRHFLQEFRQNTLGVLMLNLLNESVYNVAAVVAAVSYMLKEQALILTLNSFQPLFVLIIGVVLMVTGFSVESIDKRVVRSVVPAVLLTAVGTYLINS